MDEGGTSVRRTLPETWRNPRDGSLLRLIPAGTFLMGSTPQEIEAAVRMDKDGAAFALRHEIPQFEPWLNSYYIGIYAVTNAQYARFLSSVLPTPDRLRLWVARLDDVVPPTGHTAHYRVRPDRRSHPAAHVTWFGAVAYCRWAALRLPTELEWEKAARGTDGRRFPWGHEWRPDVLRWYENRNADETTAPVDAFPDGRSPFGLYQAAGNVEEWCADRYQANVYRRYAAGDLVPPSQGRGRVVRGGTCLRRTAIEFRCAMRRNNPPAWVNILFTGVRCACDVESVLKDVRLAHPGGLP